MATNLDLQREMNKMLEDATALLEKQTRQYQSQAQILAGMVRAQSVIGGNSDVERLEAIASGLDKASKAAEEYGSKGTQIRDVSKALEEGSLSSDKVTTSLYQMSKTLGKLTVGEQVLQGIGNGFSFVANTAKSLLSLGGGITSVLTSWGAAILSFPFAVLQNLIDMADSSGGDNSLQQELESIREEFGYLRETAGGAIVELGRSMQGSLAETGLRVQRVFGTMAERLKFVHAYVKALGPVFDALNFTVGQGGAEALGAYNKGLGLTEAGQKAIATRAVATGQGVNEINRQVANYALRMSKQFGVTMKSVSRDMGEMMANFEQFGHIAPQQLAQVAVYARKLGIEVKSLGAAFEKSLNFEDAANQAAQLSQAFGLNIDALEQMREQDPAKKLDNLRRAFFAAGRSVANMTAQERRLLATQTGLDAASIDAAFSLKNQSLSYADLQKKGDAAKRSQITQAEAMQKLSGAINRLVQSGGITGGGFFDRFFKGFDTGIRRTREFREIMINLRRALNATYRAGIEVGRAFVHSFPGIRDVMKGISGFFSPQRFREMLRKVINSFKEFFRDLTSNPQMALSRLMEKLKKGFFEFFQAGSPQGSRILDGFKSFFKAFALIANQFLKIGIENITKGIKYITDLLTGRAKLPTPGTGGAGGFLVEILTTLVTGLKPLLGELWVALQGLFTELWNKAKPMLASMIGPALIAIFAPSVIMGTARGVGALIGTTLAKGLLEAVKNRLTSQQSAIPDMTAHALEAASSRRVPRGVPPPIPGEALSSAAQSAQKSRVSPSATSKLRQLLPFLAVMGLVVAGIAALAYVVQTAGVTPASMAVATVAMIASAGVVAALSVAAKAAASTDQGSLTKAIGNMALIAVLGGAIGLGMAGLGTMFAKVPLSGIATATVAMLAGVAVMAAITLVAGLAIAVGAIGTAALAPLAIAFVFGAALGLGMRGLVGLYKGTTNADVLQVATAFVASAVVFGAVAAAAAAAVVGGVAAVPAVLLMPALAAFGTLAMLAITRMATLSKGVDYGEMLSLTGKIVAMATITGALAVTAAAVAVGGVASVVGLVGLMPLSLFANTLGVAATSMLEVFSNLSTSEIASAVPKMLGLATVIGSLTLVALALAGLGTISTLGLPALVVGMAAMVPIVGLATWAMQGVLRQISGIPGGPEFVDKAKAYGSLLTGVTAFVGNLTRISEAARPSFSLFGGGNFAENMAQIGSVLGRLVGSTRDVIRQLAEGAASLSGGAVQGAEAFSKVLSSVASLIGAMSAPIQMILSGTPWYARQRDEINSRITAVAEFFRGIQDPVSRLVSGLAGTVRGLGGFTEDQKRGAEVFSSALGGIGELIKVLLTPQVLEMAKNSNGSAQLMRLGTFLIDIQTTLTRSGGIIDSVRSTITSLVAAMSGINPAKAEMVKAIAPVIAGVFRTIGDVVGLTNTTLKGNTQQVNPSSAATIWAQTGFVTNLFTNLQNLIPNLLNSIASMPLSTGQLRGIAPKITAVKAVLDVITQVASVFNSFSHSGSRVDGGVIYHVVASIAAAVAELFVPGHDSANKLRKAMLGLSSWRFDTSGIAAKVGAVKATFESLKTIPEAIGSLQGTNTNLLDPAVLSAKLDQVARVLATISSARVGDAVNPFVGGVLARWFKSFNGIPPEVRAKLNSLKTGLTAVGSTLSAIGSTETVPTATITTKFTELSNSLQLIQARSHDLITQLQGPGLATLGHDLSETIRQRAIGTIAPAIRAMVRDVNEISTELANLQPIDISTSLDRLANNMGLGQAREFTVNRGRIQMTVNNTVTLNAGDLEYVLVNRANSAFATLRSRTTGGGRTG